jgi:hypothetical protein
VSSRRMDETAAEQIGAGCNVAWPVVASGRCMIDLANLTRGIPDHLRSKRIADLFRIPLKISRITYRLARSRVQPNVRMRHFFAHDAGMYFLAEGLLHCACNRPYDFEVRANMRYIPDPANVLFGDDKGVTRRLRAIVEKSEVRFVLVHFR